MCTVYTNKSRYYKILILVDLSMYSMGNYNDCTRVREKSVAARVVVTKWFANSNAFPDNKMLLMTIRAFS